MRAFGVSVFLEGNVIDLGDYKLQVAEACSGVRYLFPLMTLGAIVAYVFKGKSWARWCLFLSTIPITLLMNGLRIGLIGVLVDRFGIAQAEGFLHQFEGWVLFMACTALLLGEGWLLLRLSGDRRPIGQVIDFGWRAQRNSEGRATSVARLSMPVVAAAVVLVLAVYPAQALPDRAEVKPGRTDFGLFPTHIGEWVGTRSAIEGVYLDVLQLDDYLLADFTRKDGNADAPGSPLPVNLYVAYYASQRTGRAVHSPSSCLPGGGWRIEQFEQRDVPSIRLPSGLLRVNRAVISQGANRQLVYYWFQERGRDLTNEYAVKWYLLADAVTRDRTDGALVRLITPLQQGESTAMGDARLQEFASTAVPVLHTYLPD
jgi:exosortase D (VPLPA-CTERM-specific)